MDKPRALIVGARGFLGAYLAQAARQKFEVIEGGRFAADPPGVFIDLTDSFSAGRAFGIVKPELVVLLAAMSDIDRCESQPERAFEVNVRGAEIIANLCARTNARLLFTSTAAVFDGQKHGYREDDEVCPLSVYGTTKAQAEAAVLTLVPAALIIRFSLVIGFAKNPGTNSMLDSLYAKWKAGLCVPLPTSEFRSPLHAASLSQIMMRLLENQRAVGIFHLGACDSLSRYEMGRRFASRAGFAHHLVRPQALPPADRAPRGKDHFLLTNKVEAFCGIKSPTCNQEIERCFHGIAQAEV